MIKAKHIRPRLGNDSTINWKLDAILTSELPPSSSHSSSSQFQEDIRCRAIGCREIDDRNNFAKRSSSITEVIRPLGRNFSTVTKRAQVAGVVDEAQGSEDGPVPGAPA